MQILVCDRRAAGLKSLTITKDRWGCGGDESTEAEADNMEKAWEGIAKLQPTLESLSIRLESWRWDADTPEKALLSRLLQLNGSGALDAPWSKVHQLEFSSERSVLQSVALL